MYVFAEFFGAVTAAALVLPLYGFGQFGSLFDTRIFKAIGLSVPKHLAQVHPSSPDVSHSSAGASQGSILSAMARARKNFKVSARADPSAASPPAPRLVHASDAA